jgi:hypothetical protein
MKKIYNAPETKIVAIATSSIMTGSGEYIDVSESNYDGNTTVESRSHSIWDDEEY